MLSLNTLVIDLGEWYTEGISNVVVQGNMFSGWTGIGFCSAPYGRNRKIINNDFSGLTTWQGAILDRERAA